MSDIEQQVSVKLNVDYCFSEFARQYSGSSVQMCACTGNSRMGEMLSAQCMPGEKQTNTEMDVEKEKRKEK